MPIYNQFTMSKKINELEDSLNSIKSQLDNILRNQVIDKNNTINIISNMNDIRLDMFNLKNDIGELKNKNRSVSPLPNLSEEINKLLANNGLEKYVENLKYLGVNSVEDILLLDIQDFCDSGIIYLDSKKIIESAKSTVENLDLLG